MGSTMNTRPLIMFTILVVSWLAGVLFVLLMKAAWI